MLDKLEESFKESSSKINGVEQLVNDSIINSSQENSFKRAPDELNRSIRHHSPQRSSSKLKN